MHKGDLIHKISSKNTVASIKTMQVLDQNSQVFFNFINTLHSDYTRASYKFCLEKFLNHYKIDLLSFLKVPQQDITNLIIKYLVDKKVSRQYKNLITATLKHACEINDIVLNWKKIKKFINSEKTGNETTVEQGIQSNIPPTKESSTKIISAQTKITKYFDSVGNPIP